MKIEEIKEKHFEEVKNLLVELQEFIIEIDNFNLNTISKDYREKYFQCLCLYLYISDLSMCEQSGKPFYFLV